MLLYNCVPVCVCACGHMQSRQPAMLAMTSSLESHAVKMTAAEPASLYMQISQQWTLGHLPCDVNS